MKTLNMKRLYVTIARAIAAFLLVAAALMGVGQKQTFAREQTATGAVPDAPPSDGAGSPVAVVVGEEAHSLERLARQELVHFLSKRYPEVRFEAASNVPARGRAVVLGTPNDLPSVSSDVKKNRLLQEGSFVVKTVRREGQPLGVIVGADPRATLHGVYALLENLGFGFYLSYTAAPPPKSSFSFEGWELAGTPLTGRRFALNWHNFLSSAAAWNRPDWEHYVQQLARMRYTGLMVHAYGNNPMFTYTHNGAAKPMGYLATTALGRDWGTQHVNDVRRLYGAGTLFNGPVFGVEAALGPPDQRASAARQLMQHVFSFAEKHGLDVTFALDVDTKSSNPQNIIRALPPEARFETAEGYWLANPDTPAGYAFYKTQMETLLSSYPQIDHLVAWFRRLRSSMVTPWRKLTTSELPAAWEKEYEAAVARTPELGEDDESPSLFALAKVVRALRRALDESGHPEVKMGVGTWGFEHLAAADHFLPKGVALMGLDYDLEFEDFSVRENMHAVSRQRPVYPIVWAHHDDGTYLGRSYTPFANFATTLDQYEADGFGIIHWLTRPHDLYFKSLAQQVWSSTKNEPLEETAHQMAARTFGAELQDEMGPYLVRWITQAPQVGRETSNQFLNRKASSVAESGGTYLFGEGTEGGLKQNPPILKQTRERLRMLEAIKAARLDAVGQAQLTYFKELERFFIALYQAESAYRRSTVHLQQGDVEQARKAVRKSVPASVIEQYAQVASQGRANRGEKAVIISLNLRWRPFILSQYQKVGLRPVRINFQPTRHEPLAQGAGTGTFYVDMRRRLWLGLGEEETGVRTYGQVYGQASRAPHPETSEQEIVRSGIASENPFQLKLETITGEALTPGTYQVDLLMPSPGGGSATGEQVFKIALQGSQEEAAVTDRIALSAPTERPGTSQRGVARRSYTVRVGAEGALRIDVNPIRGRATLSGLVLRAEALQAPKPTGL